MWTLVFVWVLEGAVDSHKLDEFNSFNECFKAREYFYYEALPKTKFGFQAICINGDATENIG